MSLHTSVQTWFVPSSGDSAASHSLGCGSLRGPSRGGSSGKGREGSGRGDTGLGRGQG